MRRAASAALPGCGYALAGRGSFLPDYSPTLKMMLAHYDEDFGRFFRAGAVFKLDNHFRYNGDYLLTRVVHRMSQPVEIPRVKELPDSYEKIGRAHV